jgi:hypothetical protein
MDDLKMRRLLNELQAEILNSQNIDEKGQGLLREITKDIQELIDHTESRTKESNLSTAERLENTIRHLEVTHPEITSLLEKLMEILSKAGI